MSTAARWVSTPSQDDENEEDDDHDEDDKGDDDHFHVCRSRDHIPTVVSSWTYTYRQLQDQQLDLNIRPHCQRSDRVLVH